VQLYVGVDTADVSIAHARDRYDSMLRDARRQRNSRPPFDAQFHAMDCWTHWIGEIPIVSEVGADPNIGPGADGALVAGIF
jgi:mRNA (guanine-N7-)-methyltransferase